jgi:hypothetical protein
MSLATEQTYVTNVYQNILFRSASNVDTTATQNAITLWANLINTGQVTEAQVATDFASSSEANTDVVPIVQLYEGLLNRAPDAAGLAFWVGLIDSGTSLRNIAQDFVGSTEFATIHGAQPSVTALVTALYQNVLGRAPDATGLAYWVADLGGSSGAPTAGQIADVALAFMQSTEEASSSTLANIQNWLVAGVNTGIRPTTISPGSITYTLTNGGATMATEGSTVTFHVATTNVVPRGPC